MLRLPVILVIASAVQSSAFFSDWFTSNSAPRWETFKVKWGLNPFTSFNSMPRTEAEAVDQDFEQISACDETAMWRGSRYVKGGDRTLTLLYDGNGYIAGIQEGIRKGLPNGYPQAALRPPFVDDGDYYVVSAYFVNPSVICRGRSAAEFDSEGTGTDLYIQNGTNPETDSILIPKRESDVANTRWTKGKCFQTMGEHYWYNMSYNMSCDKIFPVFLLYNGGWLNAFGWANIADITSNRLEHPSQSSYSRFIKTVPRCLSTAGVLSTMHIYFTTPLLNWC